MYNIWENIEEHTGRVVYGHMNRLIYNLGFRSFVITFITLCLPCYSLTLHLDGIPHQKSNSRKQDTGWYPLLPLLLTGRDGQQSKLK
jgi:hypothetical protein